jgi:hypothetical protein
MAPLLLRFGVREVSKRFFFEKKKQKTFAIGGSGDDGA